VKYHYQEGNRDKLSKENPHGETCFVAEAMLLDLAKAGDEQAYGCLIEPYMRKAYHMALRITHNREDAEDAAQQGFLNAYSHIHQFQSQSKFSSWLLRIVINEALTKIRQRKSQDRYLSYDDITGEGSKACEIPCTGEAFHPDVLYAKAERGRVLRNAIDSLYSTSRIVVRLLGLEERQTDEAARMLQLSRSAVKTRYARARQQLRECLAERI
jgi:RNA polymerase sigma-70 factor (ECF subfamily)